MTSCEEVIHKLINQIKESKLDESIPFSKEAIDYLVESEPNEKKSFAVYRHEVTEWDCRGINSETTTDERKYNEPGFLLGEIPEVQRSVSAISGTVHNEGKPGYQLYLLSDRKLALFSKKSEHMSVSPGVIQGESDIYDMGLDLVKIIRF